MSDSQIEKQDAENDIAGKKTAVRTPAKRKSKLEREREESEEIIKSMGGAVEEGGRRTRSSARGSTATTPVTPAAKKPRVSKPKGKPKKIDVDDKVNEEGEEEHPTEDKPEIKKTVESMEVDAPVSNEVVKSNDNEEKANTAETIEKESEVEETKDKDSEAVPQETDAKTEECAKSDIAPKEDAIETSKSETPPAKESPVKRPIEEAAIPDLATEPTEVKEKANECSHINNVTDEAVSKENKTEETKGDAPANAEPTIKATESAQEVAAEL